MDSVGSLHFQCVSPPGTLHCVGSRLAGSADRPAWPRNTGCRTQNASRHIMSSGFRSRNRAFSLLWGLGGWSGAPLGMLVCTRGSSARCIADADVGLPWATRQLAPFHGWVVSKTSGDTSCSIAAPSTPCCVTKQHACYFVVKICTLFLELTDSIHWATSKSSS